MRKRRHCVRYAAAAASHEPRTGWHEAIAEPWVSRGYVMFRPVESAVAVALAVVTRCSEVIGVVVS